MPLPEVWAPGESPHPRDAVVGKVQLGGALVRPSGAGGRRTPGPSGSGPENAQSGNTIRADVSTASAPLGRHPHRAGALSEHPALLCPFLQPWEPSHLHRPGTQLTGARTGSGPLCLRSWALPRWPRGGSRLRRGPSDASPSSEPGLVCTRSAQVLAPVPGETVGGRLTDACGGHAPTCPQGQDPLEPFPT